MDDVKISSNRSFGLVFFIVFLLIAFYPLINQGEIRIWSVLISLLFLILGIINSKILTPLNKVWFKFGIFLGKIIFNDLNIQKVNLLILTQFNILFNLI